MYAPRCQLESNEGIHSKRWAALVVPQVLIRLGLWHHWSFRSSSNRWPRQTRRVRHPRRRRPLLRWLGDDWVVRISWLIEIERCEESRWNDVWVEEEETDSISNQSCPLLRKWYLEWTIGETSDSATYLLCEYCDLRTIYYRCWDMIKSSIVSLTPSNLLKMMSDHESGWYRISTEAILLCWVNRSERWLEKTSDSIVEHGWIPHFSWVLLFFVHSDGLQMHPYL